MHYGSISEKISLFRQQRVNKKCLLDLALLSFFFAFACVFTLAAAVDSCLEADAAAHIIEYTEPLQSGVEGELPGNRLDSAVMARRIPLMRHSFRGERRSGGGSAAPRFQAPYTLPVELAPVPQIICRTAVFHSGNRSFLLDICLRASTPVRAGPRC